MVMTPPASNTGPVDTIENETGNDALTNHNGRPDMFVMVAVEGVQNKKDSAKDYEQLQMKMVNFLMTKNVLNMDHNLLKPVHFPSDLDILSPAVLTPAMVR